MYSETEEIPIISQVKIGRKTYDILILIYTVSVPYPYQKIHLKSFSQWNRARKNLTSDRRRSRVFWRLESGSGQSQP